MYSHAMTFASPIGLSDFKALRGSNSYYVDKTDLITELVTRRSQVVLFPRPRRFGKTLSQSVLRYFFEPSDEDRSWLFEDLAVWQCEACREHFQKHPVIDLSFKGLKPATWEEMFAGLVDVVSTELRRHLYLRDTLIAEDLRLFQRLLEQDNDMRLLTASVAKLSQWLEAHHGAKPVILLDEYDVPIQAAFKHRYYDEAITFFRDFITMTFKDNEHLFRGVLTGILRVSKESMFSGANNLDVYSIFNKAYSTCFGFTQQEVDAILSHLDVPDAPDIVREWYNGYRFAGTTIYNPWSVLKYAASPEDGPSAHWIHSGADDVLRKLVLGRADQFTEQVKTLIEGGAIEQVVTDYMVMSELQHNPDAVWNLLLLSGYLTVREEQLIDGDIHAKLVIPNREVLKMFMNDISHWVRQPLGTDLQDMFHAMFDGDEEVFGEVLDDLVSETFSFHDVKRPKPERVYQAFVLGMLVQLKDKWRLDSNRESGYGRYDVALTPRKPGDPGVVFELKALRKGKNDKQHVDAALDSALQQIDEKRYVRKLEQAGASPIVVWAVVFDGKRVWVRKG